MAYTITPSPGTISISGTAITGVGTIFSAYKMGALIFVKDIGLVGQLASDPTGDLAGTLAQAWAGSAVSGKAFSVYMQGDPATYSKRVRDLLNALAVPKTGQNMIFDGSGITATDPGAGKVRFNSASNPTAAYISYTDADGNDITNLVKALDDVANVTSRSSLTFRPTDGANAFADLNVTGAITDNTTYATVPVSLRAGTVPANLATLAMSGVPSGRDGGALNGAETIKTADYNMVAADSGKTIIFNKATAINGTFDAVATLGATWMVLVKNIGAGTLTLDPNGSETIDGATTLTLAQNQSAIVSCNGSLLRTEAFSFGSTPATARAGMGLVSNPVFSGISNNVATTSAWSLDGSAAPTIVIANGGHTDMAAGSGLLLVYSYAFGGMAIYLVSAGLAVLVSSLGTEWVAPTTTPAAGKSSVTYSGTGYAIYNNTGASSSYEVLSLKIKPTN